MKFGTQWGRRCIASVSCLGLVLAGMASTAHAATSEEETVPTSPAVLVDEITGEAATTDTKAEYSFGATDLGIIWESAPGHVLMAFGDTFLHPGGEGAGFEQWRSNVLVGSSDDELSDGMSLDWALVDEQGNAKEIVGSKKIPGDEHTTIPTGAIQVDGRQYLAYMSVRKWGAPGQWWTNFSQLIYSDDGGATWTAEGAPRWDNNADSTQGFQMVAFERHDGFVYMFGTPNGRNGAVRVARVPEKNMLDKQSYRYWDGATWSDDEHSASEILPAKNSELSVRYDESIGKWELITLNGNADLVLRVADTPVGPWGEEQILATQVEYPGLYGGYMHPWSPDGQIYFAMSVWNQYNVALMKVDIDADGKIVNPNLLVDPSFERSAQLDVEQGWHARGNAGIDHNSEWAKVGMQQFWVRGDSGRHEVTQTVNVEPRSKYRLEGWLRTGDTVGGGAGHGSIGAREVGPGAKELGAESFKDLEKYTKFTVEFSTDQQTTLEVFAGSSMTGDRWVQGDNFSLVRVGDAVPEQPDPETPEDPQTPGASGHPRGQTPGLPATGA